MANISNIVNVTATIEAGGVLTRNFGITLFVTSDDTLQSSDRIKVYADLEDVSQDFATTTEPYSAAQTYFSQEPFPKNLVIGRWYNSDSSANLIGGTLPALATITAINDGSLELNGIDVTAIDFTSDLSYSDVATTLQAALVGAAINVSVVFDSLTTSFTITNTIAGSAETLTYASPAPSGTDVSNLFALDSDTAVSLNAGVDEETIEEAMDVFVDTLNIFYFITLEDTFKDTSTVTDLSAWVLANPNYIYFAESSDTQALITNDTSSIFASLFSEQSDRTAGDWTPITPIDTSLKTKYLSVSSAARLSSVDFDGSNTLINPKFKQRPGIETSDLTTSQETELNRKRVNSYVPVGGDTVSQTVSNIYQSGYVFANGIWQDIRYGVDWLVNAIQVSVFNVLLEVDRVSQTPQGQALVKSVIEEQCRQGVRNGLLAGGEVNSITKSQIISITGNSNFNGTLPNGFLVYPQQLSTLSEADRIARKLPPFYVWCTGSGAVNFIDINLFFEQ